MRHPLLIMILAFVLWSATFLLVYVTQATACSLDWYNDDSALFRLPLRLILIALLVASWAAVIGVFVWQRRRKVAMSVSNTSAFLEQVGTYVSIAAIVSTAICFAGVFWLTLCSG